MVGFAKGVGEETFLPSHAFNSLPSPFLHPPRRARKALEMAFSRARYSGGPKLLSFSDRGANLIEHYHLLWWLYLSNLLRFACEKPETVPQMIPNFKGGFRSGPRGRGGHGHPFFFEICLIVIELSEK